MGRTQFTFYSSFYRSVIRIKKAADRAKAYDVICAYALDGELPDLAALPDSVAIAFEVAKPVLDAGRKKAEGGKRGGQAKHTEASGKQSEKPRKQEKEQEKEKEQVQDKEQVLPPNPLPGASPQLQEAFTAWLDYKRERREPYKPTGLKALETEVLHNASLYGDEAVAALIRTCMASNWRGIIFDRLREGRSGGSRRPDNGFQTSNPFLEMLEEERDS